ncbi:MAG: hypothetical protein ACUVTX_06390 [Bacteroidales bacterium]
MANVALNSKKSLIFLPIWLLVNMVSGQNTETTIVLPFVFNDGVFVNFSQVLQNKPVPKTDLLIAEDFTDAEFYKKILLSHQISYSSSEGRTEYIDNKRIWGFASGGILYVRWRGYFSPLYMLGNISCFFLYDENFELYRNIILSQYQQAAWNRDKNTRPTVEAQMIRYGDLNKYLIDFWSGKIMRLNVYNLGRLLKNDPELFTEYSKLPLNKKKALFFYYIGIFNEKNPLYLPVN